LFVLAPAPPERGAIDPDEEAIRRRAVSRVERDVKAWQAERGDLTIPWEQAAGHMAIVVDDVGRELLMHDRLQALRFPLTFSVLPGAVYAAGAQLRLRADRRRYREILLHLPMEPLSAARMQEGKEAEETFLLVDDSPEQLVAKLEEALQRVPAAVGINNHMGSRLTANEEALSELWPVLRRSGLFFLDSRTTAESVAEVSARAAGVPSLSRHVFLDHELRVEAVAAALRDAAARARIQPVVVICHPSATVVEVLKTQLPRLHSTGIGIYPLSELVAHTLPTTGVVGAESLQP
jgi:polysaccharide deacetylase 2 family uncharacterized protein YibQ